MDIKQIATDITVFLTPFLPCLILGAEETTKEFSKKFGQAAWEKAQLLWKKINSFTQEDPKLKSAVITLADDPEDEDFQLILAKSLAKQLEVSPELAIELVNIIKDDKAIQTILIDNGSKVRNIHQRLQGKAGKQETTVRNSQAGDITQEQ